MKLFTFVLAASAIISSTSFAQEEPSYIEEMQGLGIVAGQGLACNASKYDTFELLARAYLISKASSNEVQAQGMREYNSAKVNTYVSKQMDGFFECGQIRRDFDNQLIFKSTLYGDGTIKTPDGKIITPRQPYDATLIYKKDPKIYEDIKNMTIKGNQRAQERIRRSKEMSQNGKVQKTKTISSKYGK
mgnify:CR=1 FL=1